MELPIPSVYVVNIYVVKILPDIRLISVGDILINYLCYKSLNIFLFHFKFPKV
jgi:hypothetical protein